MDTGAPAKARDIHVIALDESDSWRLPPDEAQYVQAIETVYAYDNGEEYHLAEFLGSFELWPLYTRAIVQEGSVDELTVDRIDQAVQHEAGYDVEYVHTSRVESTHWSNGGVYGGHRTVFPRKLSALARRAA